MTKEQWFRLETLSVFNRKLQDEKEYQRLLRLTEKQDEHPEEFDGACHCRTCRSYG